MEPKAKAIGLYEKQLKAINENINTEDGYWNEGVAAKQCALICVDEIIEAIDFDWMEVQNLDRQHAYWNSVKEELLKL